MTNQRLCTVTLGVQDVERSASFYASIGFTRGSREPVVMTSEPGGLLVVLRPLDEMADDLGVAPQGSGFRGLLLTFPCEEGGVDAAYERWVGAGGVGVRQPTDREPGGRAAVVADPDAHLWELTAPDPAGEDGAARGVAPGAAEPNAAPTA